MIEKIRKLCLEDPERYKKIHAWFRAIQESGIDIRKLEYLRHKIFSPSDKNTTLSQLSLSDFKGLVSKALGLAASQVVEAMASILTEFKRSETGAKALEDIIFTRETVDDFFTLMHFWPIQVYKSSSNASKNIAKVPSYPTQQAPQLKSVGAPRTDRSAAFIEHMKNIETESLYSLIDILGKKIQQRFLRAQDAYMYFSQYSTQPDFKQPNA